MTAEERFWDQVEKTETCWLWTGHKNNKGYGQINIDSKTVGAHRYSYQLHKGEIPKGKHILHTCFTPACVNPDHLRIGTPAENFSDWDVIGDRHYKA